MGSPGQRRHSEQFQLQGGKGLVWDHTDSAPSWTMRSRSSAGRLERRTSYYM